LGEGAIIGPPVQREVILKRNFALGAVLSVAGGKLMCDIGMVYDILNFMTGDNLFTHQLPRAAEECRPSLLKQHPFLSEYLEKVEPTVSTVNVHEKLAECVSIWGSELAIDELSGAGDHEFKEPLQELCDMVGSDKVVPIVMAG
jgi:hypothetical protein